MKALIMACLDRETPEYLAVAGKLYMADLYKRVFKSDNPPSLVDHAAKMQELGYYREWNYSKEELEIIDTYLDHKSDFNSSYTSIKQYESKYFVKDVSIKQTYETPQFLYARIALTVLEHEDNRLEKIKEYINLLNNKHLSLPSPNLEYIGTKKGMATSCCLSTCEDTSASITALNLISDVMNTQSAGLGFNMQIRSKGDGVRNNRVEHQGKIPYLQAQQALAKSNKQGSRGGAITQYFPFFDPEVKLLIKARNPTTIADDKVDQIDHAIIHNYLLAELVAKGEEVCLFSIKDVPDLYEAFYSKDPSSFKSLYNKYSKTNLVKDKIKARTLVSLFAGEQYETGRFYDLNIDEVNRHTPSQDPIYSSNLCVAPETTLLTTNGHQVISELEGQAVTIWNGFEWSDTVVVKTGTNQKLLTIKTNNGYSLDCTPYHKFYIFDGYGKSYKEVRAHELKPGDELISFNLPDHQDAERVFFIESVTDTGRVDDTYCVTEPKRHMAVFNGILTGQCDEIVEPTAPFHSVRELFDKYSSEYIYVQVKEQKNEVIIKEFNSPLNIINTNESKLPKNLNKNDIFEYEGNTYTVISIKRKNEIALCNIAAINLNTDYTDEEYFKVAYYALLTINWVIENSEYPFENLEYTSKARKNAGVGITGLAYELAKNSLYYSSKAGKQHIHFVAERHFYMLCKAGIQLAKEKGTPLWFDRSNYSKGWLPIDTYNRNVDSIADFTNKYDWEELRTDLLQHGLAFSFLAAMMPCESSSQTLNNTNSLYPVRDTVVIKGDGANKNIFIVPEYNTLKDKYELAWDVGYDHMIDCYAIVQKWTDQAISADYYEDFTSPWQEPLTDKVVLKRYLKKVKMGLKSTYYTNSKTRKNAENNDTQNVGCDSGGCSL